jgi:CNT family concentrative nucleoside transporter
MDRFTGLIGIALILGIAFLVSNNKRKINYRLVVSGLVLQIVIAVLVLKIPPVTKFFQWMGKGMQNIEYFAKDGANFVYGGLAATAFPRSAAEDSTAAFTILNQNGLDSASSVMARDNVFDLMASVKSQSVENRLLLEKSNMNISVAADPSMPFEKRLNEFAWIRGDSAKMALVFGSEHSNAKMIIDNRYQFAASTTRDYRAPGVFVFAINITATIILVCVLVAILYHLGLMQKIVSVVAKGMNFVMRVSGAEALSNVASAFVGQVEAQVMIRPYLAGMTQSELLASMSGSLACIAGGILVVYVSFGAKAEYLIAASLMAAPGALVISKIVFPETEKSQTMGKVELKVKSEHVNLIDAIGHGAGDGWKISMNVIAMLIGFMALIALVNALFGLIHPELSLDKIFGYVFYPFAWSMGVPSEDVMNASTLLGQKLTVNEFIAFQNLTNKAAPMVTSEKGILITSIAICGFANFSSVGMQIGGIGALAPERRADLARLGMRALLCGTLASYLSATIAGILM